MADKIEKIGESLIHHGKLNDRVYIMKLHKNDFDDVMARTEELCEKEDYSKVFAKVPESLSRELFSRGYKREAEIERFYSGKETCLFLGKFPKKERGNNQRVSREKEILLIAQSKDTILTPPVSGEGISLRRLDRGDAREMAELYKRVFESYPFPIFEEEYLKRTMGENIEYGGVFCNGKLVSIASAEKYPEYLNAEMTDFATLPEYGGNNFSFLLLRYMEGKLIREKYKTLYTIARAESAGMNITFKKCGYRYSGTLVNNTNISGWIESMNVWFRHL